MNTTGKLSVLTDPTTFSEIIQLDQDFFPNPWSKAQWLEMNVAHHLILDWNQNQGFALFGLLPGDETAHLYKILMHPNLRGSGETQKFWVRILEILAQKAVKQIYLEVEATNLSAIGFYKKVGFETLRKVKGYYSDGSDGLMMNLTL